jgi:indolepyruvate ferredoxin oxidoreductase
MRAEGAQRIVVVTDEPEKYDGVRGLPDRRDGCITATMLDAVQRALREITGATVIIYDQTCADREAPPPQARHAWPTRPRAWSSTSWCAKAAATAACKSNCISVEPLETEFGRKRADQPEHLQQRHFLRQRLLP